MDQDFVKGVVISEQEREMLGMSPADHTKLQKALDAMKPIFGDSNNLSAVDFRSLGDVLLEHRAKNITAVMDNLPLIQGSIKKLDESLKKIDVKAEAGKAIENKVKSIKKLAGEYGEHYVHLINALTLADDTDTILPYYEGKTDNVAPGLKNGVIGNNLWMMMGRSVNFDAWNRIYSGQNIYRTQMASLMGRNPEMS